MTRPSQAGEPTTIFHSTNNFVPPSPAELTSRLPNLDVTEMVGMGGMGLVYKGRQVFLDRPVAIKLIRPEFGIDDEVQRRFVLEARALAKLTHPYIVSVFDCGKVNDLFYLVMEYVEGTSLRCLIAQKAIAERDVLDYLPQIGEALQYAHETGIVHRDVKPENILVDSRNRVRLVDFGLAKWLEQKGTTDLDNTRVAGTWGYMAPEQLAAPQQVDHRADVFSTGVVFYEMLTGEIPRTERIPPSTKSTSDPRFDPIVMRAIEVDREQRYQQMREMNEAVIQLTRTPESTVQLTRTINAPIEKVFTIWTDPSSMNDWYAPTDDYTTPIAEIDLRVGGSFRVGMQHKDKPYMNLVRGQYCRIESPYILSFTWAWDLPQPCVQETQVTLEFRPNGEMTDVILTHERFRDAGQLKGHAEGWAGCLERLARKINALNADEKGSAEN